MIVKPIKTRVVNPPKDDLLGVIKQSVKKIPERSVLVVTSKVVSIWEGRCVFKALDSSKDELVPEEASLYLPRKYVPHKRAMHTITRNVLIRSAGIDESNGNGHYVLWPKNPKSSAKKLHNWIKENYGVKKFGIMITDSVTAPLRRGAIGFALAHFGFSPLNDYRQEEDLFKRRFKFEQANVVDGLAAAAVVAMGEGKEGTPLAIITDVSFVRFGHQTSTRRHSSLEVPFKQDIFYPFFARLPWKKGKR